MLNRNLCALAAAAAVLIGAAADAQVLAARGIPATPVYRQVLSLSGGRTYRISTQNLTAGGDPVLHLWGARYSSSGTRLADGELAYDDDSGGGVDAAFSVTIPVTGSYTLIMRAQSAATAGKATLYVEGLPIASGVSYGGNSLGVRHSTDPSAYVYESASRPGGSTNNDLYALDCSGRLLSYSLAGGVGNGARIAGVANVCSVVVVGTGGTASLYTNDVGNDRDLDGLGAGLEAELGTCDSATQTGCSSVAVLKDTDRDGLDDLAEVFGLDTVPVQDLPAWGSDPVHKDLFVELDYLGATDGGSGFTKQPLTVDAGAALQAFYDEGSPDDLLNPDHKPGLRVHLDLGIAPANPADTLVGNWGGSSAVYDTTPSNWPAAAATNMVPARVGVFRHGFLTVGGGAGQGNTNSYNFKVDVQAGGTYASSLAHEIGHTLGLQHWGHDTWGGQVNCKPNYRSLMNYAFGGTSFSQGTTPGSLNPAALVETAGIGVDAGFLTGSTYQFRVDGGAVDFNRDGLFSATAVRGGPTMANSECQAMDRNAYSLRSDFAFGTLPSMVRTGGRLFAFYVTQGGAIRYRSGQPTGPDSNGSCPGGDVIGNVCMTFNSENTVPLINSARSVSAIADGTSGVLLTFRSAFDAVLTVRATGQDATGAFTGWVREHAEATGTDVEPSLSIVPVDPFKFGGATQVLGLFYSNNGVYKWSTATTSAGPWTDQGNLVTSTGGNISSSLGATVIPWPSTSNAVAACGAFPDSTGAIGFYCYDRGTGVFTKTSSSSLKTAGRPGLAYHLTRNAAGAPLGDGTLGIFYLTYADPKGSVAEGRVALSRPLSASAPPKNGVSFFHNLHVVNHWAKTPNTSVALYSDPQLSAMKAVQVSLADTDNDGTQETRVDFFPLADGSFKATLTDGNDWQVMERGLCLNLHGRSTTLCGGPNKFNY